MPPTLDLTKTYTHADMILSSRNGPRINLRRAASYNAADRGPLSSTSSRFSFNHLIVSPPPSPSLPALVPRHGKPVPIHTPRRYVRALVWVVGFLLITYLGYSMVRSNGTIEKVGWANHAGEEYEMVGDSELPDFPTPVVVTDKKGRTKWTVSIPPSHAFPLEPKQYAEICMQNMEVAQHVADLHAHKHKQHGMYDYYRVDPNFMDVHEAETHGLLPGPKAKTSMREESLVGETQGSLIENAVCEKSLTFVMESGDAGMGKTLMMLWTAYGLAKKEEREFFIDDSRWAYGKYTNYFKEPPKPKCRPPPRHEMLPCPHHARHLLVSAATAAHTFGEAFNDHFEDPRKMEVQRQKPIFSLARIGYEALFHLTRNDDEYVSKRVLELRSQTYTQLKDEEFTKGMLIGVHVRHGDKHPYEFQYRDSYIPLQSYSAAAHSIISATLAEEAAINGSKIVVASDDPTVYESEEFSSSIRAQDMIRLAASSGPSQRPKNAPAIRKFVDETVGWEGGFFSPMFWSLGRPASVPPTASLSDLSKMNLPPTEEALRLRELVGRAYLLDLSILGRSDVVVCTVSSMGCRILGIMKGWGDNGVGATEGKEGWWNVDGAFWWRGVMW
ncbi:hypothetical protein B0O99DRAFT_519681 [Bisporella sp. PMI_857]|nr:hypothetical protein B0O99DRAFT_519681 [Bisporella sp. PMI_857]